MSKSKKRGGGAQASGSFTLSFSYAYLLLAAFTVSVMFGDSAVRVLANFLVEIIPAGSSREEVIETTEEETPLDSPIADLDDSGNDVPVGELPSAGLPSFEQILDALIKSIESQESGGDSNAVSPAGARGRYQVMPGTLQWWHDSDPELQYLVASHKLAQMLEEQMQHTEGDWREAVTRVAAIWYSGTPDYCRSTTPEYAGGIEFPSGSQYCASILAKVEARLG